MQNINPNGNTPPPPQGADTLNEPEQQVDIRWKNPLKHGLTGIFRVLPNEDPEEYQEFMEAYLYEMAPVGIIETDMAVRIAQETWRMKRADAYEVDMVPQIDNGQDVLHLINLVALYRGRIQRLIDRTWLALRRAKDERRARLRPAIANPNLWHVTSHTQTGPGYQQGMPWEGGDGDRPPVKMADVAEACGGFPPSEAPRAGAAGSSKLPQ